MQGKIVSKPNAGPEVYAGIDVCKDWLDVHLHPLGESFRVTNTAGGLKSLKRRLAASHPVLTVMEATGKFHRQAHRSLHAWGYAAAIVNPLRSRQFAGAIGQFAKTDRLDARVLALMAESLAPQARAPAPAPEALETLQELVNARTQAVAEQTALANRHAASQTAFLKTELAQRLEDAGLHIKRLETEIARLTAADTALARRLALLRSIPGIGPVAATALLTGLPELGSCSGKAASLLAGLAPLADDSGSRAGERHIRGGRGQVRTAVYFAAIAAARFNPPLAETYKRLIAEGKKAKVAITAIMRKLIVLANTLIKQDRPWKPHYT